MFSLSTRLLPAALLAWCLLPEPSCATPVFLENVSESGGWYDCNKKTKWTWGDGSILARPSGYYSSDNPFDNQLCWAAAASNVLQWWQDTRSDLPPTTPNGKSSTYDNMPEACQLRIYQAITTSWSNKGGSVEQAWNWWFNGDTLPDVFFPTESVIQGASAHEGGYWKELKLNYVDPNPGDGIPGDSPLFGFYSFWNGDDKNGVYSILTQSINNNWGTTLTIGKDGRGHAITMWGYDMDPDGNLIVYLTDSDDSSVGMFRQKVLLDKENNIYLTSVDGEDDVYDNTYADVGLTGCQLGEIQSFKAPLGDLVIPEPSAAVLSFCGFFLSLCHRRRTV